MAAEPSRRVKSCDGCRKKKSRCDRARPACSLCRAYGTPCTWGGQPGRRHREPFRQRHLVASTPTAPDTLGTEAGENEPPRAQLELVQTQLQALQKQVDLLEASTAKSTDVVPRTPSSSSCGRQLHGMAMSEALPLVQDYFATLNPLMPIFDEASFMALLRHWYALPSPPSPYLSADNATPDTDQPGALAAISVVLALSIQNRTRSASAAPPGLLQRCIGSAQSAVGHLLVQGPPTLLGVQILLGLVLLVPWTSSGCNPTTALVAAAATMAATLHLVDQSDAGGRKTSPGHGHSHAEEALNVFRVAFVLDRDIHMRGGLRYVLADPGEAMSPSLPSPATTEADDGLFARRVSLARIQGKIIDWVHSAAYKAESDHAHMVDHFDGALRDWAASAPTLSTPPMGDTFSLYHLFFCSTYYYCHFVVHGVFLHNDAWMDRLTTHAREHQSATAPCAEANIMPPFPRHWANLVADARDCIDMLDGTVNHAGDNVGNTACVASLVPVWNVRCAYMSAVIVLVANRAEVVTPVIAASSYRRGVSACGDNDAHENGDGEDDRRIANGLGFLRATHAQTGDERFHGLVMACQQLLAQIQQ